jgi:hypothetical protein
MALTSSKMGLRIWNQLLDLFDHAQLANNFSKIDLHDHTPGRGVLIPTEGIFDGAITTSKLSAQIANDIGSIVAWRNERAGYSGAVGASAAAGTYIMGVGLATSTIVPVNSAQHPFYFDPADLAIAGRTTQLRIRGAVITNGTAPATNFTLGLFPVATWSNTGVATLSAATATAPVVTNPAPLTRTNAVSAAFTAPAAGWYVLGATTPGTTAAGSTTVIRADLQARAN